MTAFSFSSWTTVSLPIISARWDRFWLRALHGFEMGHCSLLVSLKSCLLGFFDISTISTWTKSGPEKPTARALEQNGYSTWSTDRNECSNASMGWNSRSTQQIETSFDMWAPGKVLCETIGGAHEKALVGFYSKCQVMSSFSNAFSWNLLEQSWQSWEHLFHSFELCRLQTVGTSLRAHSDVIPAKLCQISTSLHTLLKSI